LIDAPQVLADNAERQELNAGKEHHRDDQGGKARHVNAKQQRLEQEERGVAEREERDQEPEVGPHAERDRRERGNAVEAKAEELAWPPARAAEPMPRLHLEWYAGGSEAHPREQPLVEAHPLAHAVHGIDRLAVEQTKIAGPCGQR